MGGTYGRRWASDYQQAGRQADKRRSESREATTTTRATLVAQSNKIGKECDYGYKNSVELKRLNASDAQSELKVL